MTKNKKSFNQWIQDVHSILKNSRAIEPTGLRSNWTIQSPKFGVLNVIVPESELEYEAQTKRGFVSIYLRFDDPIKVTSHIPKIEGDLNQFSGKWNLHFSGDKKNIQAIRQEAINRLVKRLQWVKFGFDEKFPHDCCQKCGTRSVPVEGVPDQSLRGCPKCNHVWQEDLSRPATTSNFESIVLSIVSSKLDGFGNSYHFFSAFNPDTGKQCSAATSGTANNIRIAELHLRGRWPCTGEKRWQIHERELPIRQWNREVKGLPHCAGDPKQILEFIKKNTSN